MGSNPDGEITAIIFKNMLLDSEVRVFVDPECTLRAVIQCHLLKENVDAFLYSYMHAGKLLELSAKLLDLDLGIQDQVALERLGVDTSAYVPIILMVFPSLS